MSFALSALLVEPLLSFVLYTLSEHLSSMKPKRISADDNKRRRKSNKTNNIAAAAAATIGKPDPDPTRRRTPDTPTEVFFPPVEAVEKRGPRTCLACGKVFGGGRAQLKRHLRSSHAPKVKVMERTKLYPDEDWLKEMVGGIREGGEGKQDS